MSAAMLPGQMMLSMATLSSLLPRDPPGVFDRPLKHSYDYIIVGSGSAGSVLASRLSEDPVSVLLIEAGGSDLENPSTQIPGSLTQLIRGSLDWQYYTVPQSQSHFAVKNQRSYLPRGKVLGGTSTINGMKYIRGNRLDFDQWAKEGCTGWSYRDVLPYFITMENVTIPQLQHSPFRGVGGPVTVDDKVASNLAFIHQEAAQSLGYKTVDCNGYNQIGFCPVQANIKDGVRCSTALCYIRPVLARRNLQVILNTTVTKVLIKDGFAYGVEMIRNGQKIQVYTKREVILSAGTMGSPHLLLLSGIGPKQQLSRFNIRVHADLPVGKNYQDHVTVPLYFRTNVTLNANIEILSNPMTLMQYMRSKSGWLATNLVAGSIFTRLGGRSNYGVANQLSDTQIEFASTSFQLGGFLGIYSNLKDEVLDEYSDRSTDSGFTVVPFLLRPKSKGVLELSSADPLVPPIIDPNYLSHPDDVEILLRQIRLLQSLEMTPAWRKLSATLIRTDSLNYCGRLPYDTDLYWRCYIRSFCNSGYHMTSTCRMGQKNDPTAVVDPSLRVIGIRNLRVVDASVMRNVPSGNTNVPTMMIGEKAADLIRGRVKTM